MFMKQLTLDHKNLNQAVYKDPYGHFYEESLIENEDDVVPDDFDTYAYNPENFKVYISGEQERWKKEKKSKWLQKGFEYDPAFMVNPIEDYYVKMIPASILAGLNEEERLEVISTLDPVTWGERYLLQKSGKNNKWTPRHSKDGLPYQSMMIRSKSKRIVARAGRRIGKCLYDETVTQTMGGRYTAKELFELEDKPDLLTMDQVTNEIKPTSNYLIQDNGYDETYRLITRSGHIDEMTQEHPYYTIRDGMPEWVNIKDLVPGDRIAVLAKFPIIGKHTLGRDLSRLLGYLISDRGTSGKDKIMFSNIDQSLLDDMQNVCSSFDCEMKQEKSNPCDWRIVSRKPRINKIIRLVKQYGMNKKAIYKSIPNEIFTSSEDDIREFISAAWDCDGWASVQTNVANSRHPNVSFEIGYGTSSLKLAKDIKHLLLMLGIFATLRRRKVMYKGEYRPCYQVTINNNENAIKFTSKIKLLQKQPSLDKILELVGNKKSHNGKSYYTQMPIGLVNEIEKRRTTLNINSGKMCATNNKRYRQDGRCYSIEKAIGYATKINATDILSLINNDDILWDEVKCIESMGNQHSYAITVPETETFIANDTITHNTGGWIVKLAHRAFTWMPSPGKSTFNIVIFTPNQSQIRLIFKMLEVFIDGNEKLLSMVGGKGTIPTRANPTMELELTNGVTIRGFVSGSNAVRGSAADILWLDEASFLDKQDTDSVVMLINEHKDVELWVSSTPQGLKDWFYDRVHDEGYVDFFFPSDKFHPFWSKQMEADIRSNLTESGYNHEVLASFSSDGEGVFQVPFVNAAQHEYEYSDIQRNPACVYGLGVDWNDTKNGTKIRITELDPVTRRYRQVAKAHISIEGWTQTAAVQKVKEMNRIWMPAFLYVDQGFGGMQIEALHSIGSKAPLNSVDRMLLKVKGISFKAALEVIDPWTQKKVKKATKSFMVNNAVRIFENYLIDYPSSDVMLTKQLEGYRIDHVTKTGDPVYEADAEAGDHELDAMMLSLLGFILEMSEIGKPNLSSAVVSGLSVERRSGAGESDGVPEGAKDQMRRLAVDKAKERQEVLDSHVSSSFLNKGSLTGFGEGFGRRRTINNPRTLSRITHKRSTF